MSLCRFVSSHLPPITNPHTDSLRNRLRWGTLLLLILLLCNCVSVPYQAGTPDEYYGVTANPAPLTSDQQIVRGRPVRFLDNAGHYFFSLPEKLILWNWNMGRHRISPETEELLRQYLADNQLPEVKVRLNQYSPGDEFRRLFKNKAVGAGYRYTVGILLNVFYTILPGRLFGGDHYNPFTNTINLYSDHPAVALHEAGHARDMAETKWKGTHAMLRMLPLVSLFDEEAASSDALSYFHEQQLSVNERDAYKVLYPAFGTYVGGEATRFFPTLWWLNAAAAIPGHVVGRIRAAAVDVPGEQSREQELAQAAAERRGSAADCPYTEETP